jgi:hypothetical protein
MSLIGSSVAQSIAGLSQAERAETKAKAPAAPKDAKPSRKDDKDRVVVDTETADAVRGLKSNDQEEAREDRQEHPGYTPQGALNPHAPPANLDING